MVGFFCSGQTRNIRQTVGRANTRMSSEIVVYTIRDNIRLVYPSFDLNEPLPRKHTPTKHILSRPFLLQV